MTVETAANTPKVWLITGCSSGLGRLITLEALARGDKVIATARKPVAIKDLAEAGAHTLALDVTASDETLAEIAKEANNVYGHIDILVNNAGYILQGAVEECSREEIQATFSTNVFGMFNVLRAFLPYLRARRSGVVATLGSIAGWRGTPNAGLYCSTKFAIAGFTESLKAECKHLNIEVVCIEPGYTRTNFLSSGHRNKAQNAIEDYDEATRPIAKALDAYNCAQPNDPVKSSRIIVQALTHTGPFEGKELPTRLMMGRDAVEFVDNTLAFRKSEQEAWRDVVKHCDHDE